IPRHRHRGALSSMALSQSCEPRPGDVKMAASVQCNCGAREVALGFKREAHCPPADWEHSRVFEQDQLRGLNPRSAAAAKARGQSKRGPDGAARRPCLRPHAFSIPAASFFLPEIPRISYVEVRGPCRSKPGISAREINPQTCSGVTAAIVDLFRSSE